MTRVLILTPSPDNPRFGQIWREMFDQRKAPLERAGLQVFAHPWTDVANAERADAILPLLAWGYHLKPEAWLDALAVLETSAARVLNPVATLAWNTSKAYLLELARAGAPVVPTLAAEVVTEASIEAARAHFGVDTVVVKPQVSAGSQSTLKLARGDSLEGAPGTDALIQPFLPAVGGEGELSLFYFAGRFSHAVSKVAAEGDFRVQPQFGGAVRTITPPSEALAAAQTVLKVADRNFAYARIDLLRGEDGTMLLMELEAIEPDLFLDHAPDGGDLFAQAVVEALKA